MERCNGCGREKESTTSTAYLITHKRVEGICQECKERVEQEDIDSYTHKALQDMCNVVNGRTAKELAKSMFRTIQREHRYLQNEFFSALWHFFKLYGEQDENHRDARNEWAVQVAKRWEQATFD